MNTTLQRFEVPKIAFPLILSNLTVPLLGLVDSTVMGHLSTAYYLAAVGFGVSIFDFVYWCFGFLRQGTTGFIAQAYGRHDLKSCVIAFEQGIFLAIVIALGIWLLIKPIELVIQSLLYNKPILAQYTLTYFHYRIIGAPATLMNYVFNAWFLGVKRTRHCLYQMCCIAGVAIIMDIILVFGLHWNVRGVALADVAGQCVGVAYGLIVFFHKPFVRKHLTRHIFIWHEFKKLLFLNRDIFIRTTCLMTVYLLFNYVSAQYGKTALAANTALVDIMMLMAYAQDGFNNAAEILVGNSLGQKNMPLFWQSIRATGFWSIIVGVSSTLFFACTGQTLIQMITSIPSVILTAEHYLPWVILSPLITLWGFWLDGVFMGATEGKILRNGMIFATLAGAGMWFATQHYALEGLWLSFLFFFLMRGVAMGWHLKRWHIKSKNAKISEDSLLIGT